MSVIPDLNNIHCRNFMDLKVFRMENDTAQTLADIQDHSRISIIPSLLHLQKYKMFSDTSAEWVEALKWLTLERRGRKRRWNDDGSDQRKLILSHIDANMTENYIAVSYTWEVPRYIESSTGSYLIESKSDRSVSRSHVRDSVLDRVIAFIRASNDHIGGFWIDQECIAQDDLEEKTLAINSMEYVYRRSQFPVGLLSVCIESEDELSTLKCVLEQDEPPQYRVPYVFKLLDKIISDPWWERVWTFQEDYCSSYHMKLLIPHSPSLETMKRRLGGFGRLKNDLCVKCSVLREKATKVAQMYLHSLYYRILCKRILERAGKYNVQLSKRDVSGNLTIDKPMSPVIISNVTRRKATIQSDRLAVIANCCDYPIRLNTQRLEQGRGSLSLAILAIYLLNGEILMNGVNDTLTARNSTITDFLADHALRAIQPPDIQQRLTFLKQCRLKDVDLTKAGIKTSGHLWKLGKILPEIPPRGRSKKGTPDLEDLQRHLEDGKFGAKYTKMAINIRKYIREVEDRGSNGPTFGGMYKDLMGKEVIKAMTRPMSLRLACIVPPGEPWQSSPYCGIFVSQAGAPWTENPSYVFTSMAAGNKTHDGVERHVSLEVEMLNPKTNGVPRLVVNRWINGLIFYTWKGNPEQDVIFPWPESFTG
ncbi:hypothetical protein FE257_007033 [Aspergillus nanangensis]|uniref:Heterokaryon incompatibility domain-containing protein n=1 Tax=Aspergillus nanangensis TaxID=2582783 RepID=A0AAD4CQ75_ASPNN|nr:hypothetical protein FE257_007033 [Aspergillus nanangensis]